MSYTLASSPLWLLKVSLKILLHEQNSHHTAVKRTSPWLNSFYIAKLCQNWHPLNFFSKIFRHVYKELVKGNYWPCHLLHLQDTAQLPSNRFLEISYLGLLPKLQIFVKIEPKKWTLYMKTYAHCNNTLLFTSEKDFLSSAIPACWSSKILLTLSSVAPLRPTSWRHKSNKVTTFIVHAAPAWR